MCKIVLAIIRSIRDNRLCSRGANTGKLIESPALAELISTNCLACANLVAAAELGDFDGESVCATAGSARSRVKPIALK